MVKKTLVFHFYVKEDFENNVAMKFHLAILKHYANIFDKVIFCISVDNLNDTELIARAERAILDCGFKKEIQFIPVENDMYREAATFKSQILDKLKDIEGIVFFGHVKGVTNVNTFSHRAEHFLKWILALYFYSLEFADEAELKLVGIYQGLRRTFFGPLYTLSKDVGIGWYPGTFFWLNPKKLYNDIQEGVCKLTEIDDRDWVECLPSIYKYNDGWGRCTSHNDVVMYDGVIDLYKECDWDFITNFYGEKDKFFDLYYKLYNEIKD